MKNIFTIVTAAVLLFASSFMTSCSSEDLESLAPSNTWCEMPVDWDDDGSSNLYVAMIYNENTLTGQSGSSNLKSGLTFEPGITIVVFAKTEIKKLGMSAGTYTFKTFPSNTDTVTDDGETYTFKGSRAKWAAIYWSKAALRDANSQNEHPKAPGAITNSSTYVQLSGDELKTFKENFSWKKLLANYLLGSL